jgi:hypothetical protein
LSGVTIGLYEEFSCFEPGWVESESTGKKISGLLQLRGVVAAIADTSEEEVSFVRLRNLYQ